MKLKNLLAVWLILLFTLSGTLLAKEYTNTSYYVAYDTADNTQYVLVMPSVNKIYTHKAGHILPTDLKQIDTQFETFPTYSNGELCFSTLIDGASGEDGASVMEGQCYTVNFFYTQKEAVEGKGMAFILTYTTTDTVYEGLAGDALSFKVVKKGDVIDNDNSISGDDYTYFRFNADKGKVLLSQDITPPVLTLIGKEAVVQSFGNYVDEGATAIDDIDGDLSTVADPVLDANSPAGTYTVIYTATDVAGNEGSATRTVTINECEDMNPLTGVCRDLPFLANAGADKTITEGDSVTLNGSGSGDSDGSIISYVWKEGNVTLSTTQSFTKADFVEGVHIITLTVKYDGGATAIDSVVIRVHAVSSGSIKKTGQTKSYNEAGDEVTDNSIKDDGFYQTGVTPSYTRDDSKEVVTDHVTGLEWQDDAEAATITKNWEDAQTYCSGLSLDGGGWRLPTVQELQGIVVDGTYNPSIDASAFENYTTAYDCWSSTTYADYTSNAWVVYFYYGYTHGNDKSATTYVRCVR